MRLVPNKLEYSAPNFTASNLTSVPKVKMVLDRLTEADWAVVYVVEKTLVAPEAESSAFALTIPKAANGSTIPRFLLTTAANIISVSSNLKSVGAVAGGTTWLKLKELFVNANFAARLTGRSGNVISFVVHLTAKLIVLNLKLSLPTLGRNHASTVNPAGTVRTPNNWA